MMHGQGSSYNGGYPPTSQSQNSVSYNGFQSIQDYEKSKQQINASQHHGRTTSEVSSDYPFNDVIDVYGQSFDSELESNPSPLQYCLNSPKQYVERYEPQTLQPTFPSTSTQYYQGYLANNQPHYATTQPANTIDSNALRNNAYTNIFDESDIGNHQPSPTSFPNNYRSNQQPQSFNTVGQQQFVSSSYENKANTTGGSSNLSHGSQSLRGDTGSSYQSTYINQMPKSTTYDDVADYYTLAGNQNTYGPYYNNASTHISNVSQVTDRTSSSIGSKNKKYSVEYQNTKLDHSQIEALEEYTNQVIDLVDCTIDNIEQTNLPTSNYDTAFEHGSPENFNNNVTRTSLPSSPSYTSKFKASITHSNKNLAGSEPQRQTLVTSKPLGPRKLPSTLTVSPEKSASTKLSSRLHMLHIDTHGNQYNDSTVQSPDSTISSFQPKTPMAQVVTTPLSPNVNHNEKYYRHTLDKGSLKLQLYPGQQSQLSVNKENVNINNLRNTLDNPVITAQISEELNNDPNFVEKQQGKTIIVDDKNKTKRISYSQSVRINNTTSIPTLKPLSKTATWGDSETTEMLLNGKEEKRNAKLPPVPLDLPALPFSSSSLTESQLKQCIDLWSLSKLFSWCLLLKIWFKDALIPKEELKKSLAALIHHRYSKLSVSLVEDNVDTIVEEFERNGCVFYKNVSSASRNNSISGTTEILNNDCYVFFNEDAYVNGVLPQLSSCYSTKFNHRKSSSNQVIMKNHMCYALHCPREKLKRINSIYLELVQSNRIIIEPTGLKANGQSEIGDSWVEHWNITKDELSEIDEITQQRQSHMFDLIKGEQRVVNHGRIIVEIYGESFLHHKPPLIPSTDKFYHDAFLTVIPIVETHKKFLLEPLIVKLKQGKFMTGVADLYSKWVHEAYIPYLKYVDRMVGVRELIEYETKIKKSSRFSTWINNMDSDPRVSRFGMDHGRLFGPSFLGATMNLPITLKEIQKNTSPTDPEYKRLEKALKAVRKLIDKFNTMQDHAVRTRALSNLANSLYWKNGTETNLEWESQDRRIIKRGQVSKKRDMWLNSYSHLILLDNYLLITDEIKDSPTLKKYRVIEKPISMKFLLVEIDVATKKQVTQQTNQTISSRRTGSTISETITDTQEDVIYPFKIRNIGKETSFTFYTNSVNERIEWLDAISDAQSRFYENEKRNEPFKLKVISDAAFAYDRDDIPHKSPLCPKNSAVDIALQEIHEQYPGELPRPLMYSKVATAESFTHGNKEYIFVGLGYGVFLSDATHTRNWKRVLELKNVTQLKVLEEFNLLVVLADKILQYYKLDSIFTVYNGIKNKSIGQKLSKQYVNFFKIGQQKGSTLLFYSKQKVSSSGCYFKVMVPKLDDASNSFEYFEEYRKFNIQAECFNLTIFNNTFSIHTVKGFEILSLSILQPQSIPILMDLVSGQRLESGNVEIIKKKLNLASCKPMGLYKINENKELLLVYNEFAIICNNHGSLSRFSILQFSFKCTKVAFQDDFLIIVGKNIIEIFKIDLSTCILGSMPKPIQVVSGKDINLIDDTPGKIKFSMLHPSRMGRQLVVELVPNEYYKNT